MPSKSHRIIEFGLAVFTAVGLTLVAYAWIGPDQRDSTPGLAMLVIGAVGFTVRSIGRAGTAGQEQRREILGTIKQVGEGGTSSVEAEALRREREQLDAERAEFEAERTKFYAQAVAETLQALNQRNDSGHVKLLLPKINPQSRDDEEWLHGDTSRTVRVSDRFE